MFLFYVGEICDNLVSVDGELENKSEVLSSNDVNLSEVLLGIEDVSDTGFASISLTLS